MSARRDTIRIANCGGFWGDDPTAAKRQVDGGPVDYLVMDYLAEVTMAILQKQKAKDHNAGYAKDFIVQMGDVLPAVVERDITVITNAGGVNPAACAAAVEALAAESGVAEAVRVAIVEGDDIYPELDTLLAGREQLRHIDSGAALSEVRDRVLSANAYIGAAAVVAALEMGANIVIAGRVTDTGVTLAPMIHEFGWADDDWDRLAAGIVAGHIIECGSQCTGGNFTDWQTVPDFTNIGYPIVEAHADGTFVVTKHDGTGGLVNVHTVSEQLLYEMGAPAYLAPDCIARFDTIQLAQVGPDRVLVSGVRGEAPPERLKVAISFSDGYRAVGRLLVGGPDALPKAEKAAQIFWTAAGGAGSYDHASTQFIGWDAAHPPLATEAPGEVLMQVAVRDHDKKKIDQRFAPMVVGKMLSSVPGFTIPADQGRPRASDVVGHWPALISRDAVKPAVTLTATNLSRAVSCAAKAYSPVGASPIAGEPILSGDTPIVGAGSGSAASADSGSSATSGGGTVTVPLLRLCLARSGDKGDTANVGVLARSPEVYAWIKANLTAEVVRQYFKGVCTGPVERFELDNLGALNFLLHESLGGGGALSLRFDAQGKTFSQYLLAMTVEVPASIVTALG